MFHHIPLNDEGRRTKAARLSSFVLRRWSVLALERSSQQAAHEVAAEENIDQQRRHRNNQRPGHLDIPLRVLAAGEILERDGNWPNARLIGDDQPEKELVPDRGELP